MTTQKDTKACTSCHVDKPLSDFYKERSKTDGRQSMCKACASAYQKAYQATPRGRYVMHRENARRRGVSFLLSFDSWWNIWEPHWERRGCGRGELVMARHSDSGPYAVGNVEIITHAQNVKDAAMYRKQRAAVPARLAAPVRQGLARGFSAAA
jgi:hypothetical protein